MENNQLEKKYGLATAICMVVGTVIGSGVFFKAETILKATGGNLPMGIIAWLVGGMIMIVCAGTFAIMATKYEYVNGAVDYADVTVGKKYGYFMGWYLATVYCPTLTSVLAWVSARYFCVLIGFDITGPQCMLLSMLLMIFIFAMNTLAPKVAGKFQVTTTVIKLIPILLMAVVGTIVGLSNGTTIQNFTSVAAGAADSSSPLFRAIVATAFAYEGWIITTSINAELKDGKKNLPIALIVGTFAVMLIYILYYIGISGAADKAILMESGEQGARIAFSNLFSNVAGTILFVFVVISCIGTLNGLMLGCVRNFYALAHRNLGPAPKMLDQVDKESGMPHNAAIMGLVMTAIWLVYFYGANLDASWFGPVCFDSSELPIVTMYGMYIPMFIMFIKKEKDLPAFKRYILPILAIIGSASMLVAAVYAHGIAVAWYCLVTVVIMLIGAYYLNKTKSSL